MLASTSRDRCSWPTSCGKPDDHRDRRHSAGCGRLQRRLRQEQGKSPAEGLCEPGLVEFAKPPSIERGSGTFFAERSIEERRAMALDRIEGPEDIILDRNDHLYSVDRNGSIIRFRAPGIRPASGVCSHRRLGMALDREENLPGLCRRHGVYGVRLDRTVFRSPTRPTVLRYRFKDDSRLWLAGDLDVARAARSISSTPPRNMRPSTLTASQPILSAFSEWTASTPARFHVVDERRRRD
ncbi:hypothetical protein [Bradyrhizobium sp. 14AA]